jgi:hypothetical protein
MDSREKNSAAELILNPCPRMPLASYDSVIETRHHYFLHLSPIHT